MWGVTEITAGGVNNDYLSLTTLRELFPDDTFGGPTDADAGRPVRVYWGGEPVDTDIVRSGSFFRRRAWVGEFIRLHRLRPGDRVVVEQLAPYAYHVYPLRAAAPGIQSGS
jgi:hypothetical protein